jgi:hypothetical protein
MFCKWLCVCGRFFLMRQLFIYNDVAFEKHNIVLVSKRGFPRLHQGPKQGPQNLLFPGIFRFGNTALEAPLLNQRWVTVGESCVDVVGLKGVHRERRPESQGELYRFGAKIKEGEEQQLVRSSIIVRFWSAGNPRNLHWSEKLL